VLPWRYDS